MIVDKSMRAQDNQGGDQVRQEELKASLFDTIANGTEYSQSTNQNESKEIDRAKTQSNLGLYKELSKDK